MLIISQNRVMYIIILCLMYCIFRIGSDDLLQDAVICLKRQRECRAPDNSGILVKNVPDIFTSDSNKVNTRTVINRITGPSFSPEKTRRDEETMDTIINYASPGNAVIPSDIPRRSLIPAGVPLLDLVRAHSTKDDAWKYPQVEVLHSWAEQRGPTYNTLDDIFMKHIVIGMSDEEVIQDATTWVKAQMKRNEKEMPVGLLPLVVRTKEIPIYDLFKISRAQKPGTRVPIHPKLASKKAMASAGYSDKNGTKIEDAWIKIPVQIVIGDGITWGITISFDIQEEGGRLVFVKSNAPEAMVELFDSLPSLVSMQTKEDTLLLEAMGPRLGLGKIRLSRIIELESLMIYCGWAHAARGRLATSFITLGVPINRSSISGDGKWWKRFSLIPRSLRIQVLYEVKWLYLVVRVLMICARSELAPDPDIACKITGLCQYEFLIWLAKWIVNTVTGVFMKGLKITSTTSRQQLLGSLRAVGKDGRLLGEAPYRVRVAALLIKDSLTLSEGGPRFLHLERERFLRNYQIFGTELFPGFEKAFGAEIDGEVLLYARFEQYSLDTLDFKSPVRSYPNLMLVFHPKLKMKQLEIDLKSLSVDSLRRIVSLTRRSVAEGVLEWARLHPREVEKFFDVCAENPQFGKRYRALYEPLRLLALHVLDEHVRELPICEQSIRDRRGSALREERDRNAALSVQLTDIKQKMEELEGQLAEVGVLKIDSDRALAALENEAGRDKLSDRSKWRGARPEKNPPKNPEPGRRGVSPESRAAEQAPIPMPVLPARQGVADVPGSGWKDLEEAAGYGRLVPSPVKRNESGDPGQGLNPGGRRRQISESSSSSSDSNSDASGMDLSSDSSSED